MVRSRNPFRCFNSSPEVIRAAVMLYIRYPLSLRNVEDLLFERGIDICHETVRFWWNRFGPMFAADIRRQRVSRMRGFRHWRWHLDEMYVKLNGEMVYLWRAVDHEGEVLKSFVTRKRDKSAALAFMKKALKRHGRAEKIVTDGLRCVPGGHERTGQSRTPRDRTLAQQPGREFPPAIPTTRAGHAAVSTNEVVTEIRLGSCFHFQPFQLRTPPRRSPNLQATTLGRLGRVAEPHGMNRACLMDSRVDRRPVAISLTAPVRKLELCGLTCLISPPIGHKRAWTELT